MLRGDYTQWKNDFTQVVTQSRADSRAPKLGLKVEKSSSLGEWDASKGNLNWVEERKIVASPRGSKGSPLTLQLRVAEPQLDWLDPTDEDGDLFMSLIPQSITAVITDHQGVEIPVKAKTSSTQTTQGWIFNLCFWFYPGQLQTAQYVECSLRTTYMLQWLGFNNPAAIDAKLIKSLTSSVIGLYMLAARFGYAPVPRLASLLTPDTPLSRFVVSQEPRQRRRRSIWQRLMRRSVGSDGKIPRGETLSSHSSTDVDVTFAQSFLEEDARCVPVPTTGELSEHEVSEIAAL